MWARSLYLALLLLSCGVSLSAALSCSPSATVFSVEMSVFSGTRNPAWNVVADAELCSALAGLSDAALNNRSSHLMGYSGFSVRGASESSPEAFILGVPAVELRLIASAPAALVSDAVRAHVVAQIVRIALQGGEPVAAADRGQLQQCKTPIVGPDSVPAFAPSTDDGGCFVSDQQLNNCYDYGCDIVTDTFAQPGRGTGSKWVANNCTEIRRAAEHDGLVWAGTELPAADPKVGHYVSLHIWPETNFHWLRRDANGAWSHKPGGTAVRNLDNAGKAITDPAKADVSPWTVHCGYMSVVPSKVKIS